MKATVHKPTAEEAAPTPDGRVWRCLAAMCIFAVAAYSNSLGGKFVFDDVPSIPDNTTIRSLGNFGAVLSPPHDTTVAGRPVLNLSLAVNYAIGGLDVLSYHIVNLAVHILAGMTLFGIIRRTLTMPRFSGQFADAAPWLALAAATLWMLHPLQVESVAYMVQRAESLMGLLYLLTLYAFIRSAVSQGAAWRWQALAVVCCALGMGAKEVMATAPLVVLLYDRTFVAGTFREALRRHWPMYAGLAATWAILAALVAGGPRSASAGLGLASIAPLQYAATQFGVVLHYLRLAFWPAGLAGDYFDWPVAQTAVAIVPPALAITAMMAVVVWAIIRRPAWGFLGAWFFVILAPSSSIVPIADLAFEHRMYLSLASAMAAAVIGVYLLGAKLVAQLPAAIAQDRRSAIARRVAAVAFVLAAACLGTLTYLHNADYRGPRSFWQSVVQARPGNARPHASLGDLLADAGDDDKALGEYNTAIKLKGDYAIVYYNRGKILAHKGKYSQAIRDCTRAIELMPARADFHNNRGLAYKNTGQYDLAIGDYTRAIELDAGQALPYYNRAVALRHKARYQDAIDDLDKAIKIQPHNGPAYFERARCRIRLGQPFPAREDLDTFRSLGGTPDNETLLELRKLTTTAP